MFDSAKVTKALVNSTRNPVLSLAWKRKSEWGHPQGEEDKEKSLKSPPHSSTLSTGREHGGSTLTWERVHLSSPRTLVH